jgi:hypothetical protein
VWRADVWMWMCCVVLCCVVLCCDVLCCVVMWVSSAPIVHRLLRCNADDVIALTRLFSITSGPLKHAHVSRLLGVNRDISVDDVTKNPPAENTTLLNNILLGANIMMAELWTMDDYTFTADEVGPD